MRESNDRNKDLLDRTLNFSEGVIKFSRELDKNIVNKTIVSQLIRSATSIGANYREACEGESSKDFVHKIRIAKKEARETEYWLRLLLKSDPGFSNKIDELLNETVSFIKIFSVISSKFK